MGKLCRAKESGGWVRYQAEINKDETENNQTKTSEAGLGYPAE